MRLWNEDKCFNASCVNRCLALFITCINPASLKQWRIQDLLEGGGGGLADDASMEGAKPTRGLGMLP